MTEYMHVPWRIRVSTCMYPDVYEGVHTCTLTYTREYMCVPPHIRLGTYMYHDVYEGVHSCTHGRVYMCTYSNYIWWGRPILRHLECEFRQDFRGTSEKVPSNRIRRLKSLLDPTKRNPSPTSWKFQIWDKFWPKNGHRTPKIGIFEKWKFERDPRWWPLNTINMAVHDYKKSQGQKHN